jgi:ankyrin repeat protein
MSKTLTLKTRLESLKKQAKAWLKDTRAGDAASLARLTAAWPNAPAHPILRDIQHALALEYDQKDWISLKAALNDLAFDARSRAERVDAVLRHGWGGDLAVARRVLERDPSIAQENLATAVVCGDLAEVERRLAADPAAADRQAGPLKWTPLLYLAFSRLPGPGSDNAIAIASRLLDLGADPNAAFNDGWENPFKVLTGVIGQGEGGKPTHERAAELVALLIERGAEPYDTQALYNTSIVSDDTDWIDLLYRYSERQGATARWSNPDAKPSLGGQWRLGAIDYLLGNAVSQNHPKRAQWLLDHGANPNAVHGYTGQPVHVLAQLSGFNDMTALLERNGAQPVRLEGAQAFRAACLRSDGAAAHALLASSPEFIKDPSPLLAAAELGRDDAVALLLSLGAPVGGIDREGFSPLHRAVQSGSAVTVDRLLAAGADVNLREQRWHGTPLSWAVALDQAHLVDRLAGLSRDVRALTVLGLFDRLEQVLTIEPSLVNEVVGGNTSLFCLPDDEDLAVAAARLLLDHGARPGFRDAEGLTAADAARKRGLDEASDLLADVERGLS